MNAKDAGIWLIAAALFALDAGCATPKPRAMLGDENFALLYTTPVNCVARGACVARINIRAINGEATQNLTTQYNFQVDPRPLSVIVLAHTVLGDNIGHRQGVCELSWTARAGALYVLDRTIVASSFHVTAKEGDETVSSCVAEFA